MGQQLGCLARYGRMNRMEWFDYEPELADSLERGRAVVVQSRRGEELAEVLIVSGSGNGTFDPEPSPPHSLILRIADEADLGAGRLAEESREERFEACLGLLLDGRWPVDLVDVEILLDGRTTVAYVVKDDDFDLTALRSQFRAWFDFETILEPASLGEEAAILIPAAPALVGAASGGCGSGGCGSSGGGCGVGR